MSRPLHPEEADQTRDAITIHLFLVTGATFTFKSAAIESDNESELTFSYIASSDCQIKRARFSKRLVAGYSTW